MVRVNKCVGFSLTELDVSLCVIIGQFLINVYSKYFYTMCLDLYIYIFWLFNFTESYSEIYKAHEDLINFHIFTIHSRDFLSGKKTF